MVFDDHVAAAPAFAAHYGSLYPSIIDPGGVIANSYGVTSPPTTFVINAKGVVAATLLGPVSAAPARSGGRARCGREGSWVLRLWCVALVRRRGGGRAGARAALERAARIAHLETLVRCPCV